MLCEVAAGIAYRAIRNRGTIGGSIAHADPAADWPLGAGGARRDRQYQRDAGGARAMPVEKFMLGAFTTALRGGRDHRERRGAQAVARGALRLLQVLPQDRRVRRGERGGGVRSGNAGRPRSISARFVPAPVSLSALARRVAQEGQSAASEEAISASGRRGGGRPRSGRAPHACCRRDARPAAGVRVDDADRAHCERARQYRRWSSRAPIWPISCASIAG